MSKNKIKEILTRGVEEVIMKESLEKKLLSGRKLRIKHGVDPTSPYLHLGNAIPLWKLKQFQDLGHRIVLIVGDFTARIGDTSDKTSQRPALSKQEVERNMRDYKKQIGKILDIRKTEFVYNSKWLSRLSLSKIVKLASNFTVAQMLERENFMERYQSKKPIGLQEFIYPLMQGYDSVIVKADVEVGGTDQIFNMLAGRTIQRYFGQNPQDVITLTLIEGTDGGKMSKSLGNVISLTDSPDEMYGKIMSMKDELIIKYFILCTQVSLSEIEKIETSLKNGANPRDVKARLAKEIVSLYYGKEIAKRAEEEFNRIFKEHKIPDKIPSFKFEASKINILDLLVKTKLVFSKSEAKRLIEQKGVKINNSPVEDWKKEIELRDGMVVSIGRRKFVRIIH